MSSPIDRFGVVVVERPAMTEEDNLPIPGERCRLRGRKPTGMISFVDLETGWARVNWDDEYKGTPEIWQQSALDAEEADYDLEEHLEVSGIQDQQSDQKPPIFPTGFRRIFLRAVRALTGRTPSL